MIFSYLIVPAICANLLAESMPVRLLIGWLTATIASVVGLYFSFKKDLPTGASIVCALGAALILIGFLSRARHLKTDPKH
jgi:zinc/manganese transport system permease protein